MRYAILMFGIILYACVEDSVPEQPVPGRWYTAAQVSDGESLYQGHCAVCHGVDGSATAEWRTPDTNGVYPPPFSMDRPTPGIIRSIFWSKRLSMAAQNSAA